MWSKEIKENKWNLLEIVYLEKHLKHQTLNQVTILKFRFQSYNLKKFFSKSPIKVQFKETSDEKLLNCVCTSKNNKNNLSWATRKRCITCYFNRPKWGRINIILIFKSLFMKCNHPSLKMQAVLQQEVSVNDSWRSLSLSSIIFLSWDFPLDALSNHSSYY